MDLAVAFQDINWISILLAAITSFLIGGLWYGPLFGKSWMEEFGFTIDDLKNRNVPKTFGVSLIMTFIASFILDMFIGSRADMLLGGMAGFFVGFGWVATMLAILYLFEMKSIKAYLINAGYCVLSLTVNGIVLGAL